MLSKDPVKRMQFKHTRKLRDYIAKLNKRRPIKLRLRESGFKTACFAKCLRDLEIANSSANLYFQGHFYVSYKRAKQIQQYLGVKQWGRLFDHVRQKRFTMKRYMKLPNIK